MEILKKKRKGPDILPLCPESPAPLTIISSHLSMEDCEEGLESNAVSSSRIVVTRIVSAPPSVSGCSDLPGRGLKRKIGCIDVATQMGRIKKIEQEYFLGAAIGQGKFGSVVLCQNKTSGEEFACKTLRKGNEIVHREVEIMQHLSGHPGVVTLKAVYEDSESFHLVMELCSGGQLLDHMIREGRYSENRAANILKELVSVIKYCHDLGVVHRDIKPENILLTTSGRIKLADFGLALRVSKGDHRKLNGQSLTGVVGSPAYVAPEVLVRDYSEKVDIWSAGVLLHAFLVGLLPFGGDSLEGVFDAIKKVNLDFDSGVWESVSESARDLIANMLTRDVSARLTADEVLRHPWVLLYTEPNLKRLMLKPKMRNHARLTKKRSTVIPGAELERSKVIANASLNEDSSPVLSSGVSSKKLEEQDCGLVDALAAAISRVRISEPTSRVKGSEPKRSRLCSPANPIQQQCSSNMTTNTLCKAF